MAGMRRNLALALIAMLIAACTGGTALSGIGSIGQTAARPQLPETAKQRTADGAVALARYYFESLDWTLKTGDALPANAIASPHCDDCILVVNLLLQARADTRSRLVRLVTDGVVLLQHRVFIGAEFGLEVTYHFGVDQGVVPLPGDGQLSPHVMSVWVDWRGDRWRIISLGLA